MDTYIALPLILILVWEMLWKSIALWKAAKNNQKIWYVCLVVFNTIGILPILYILFFDKKENK